VDVQQPAEIGDVGIMPEIIVTRVSPVSPSRTIGASPAKFAEAT
jgi:hypothetical protein